MPETNEDSREVTIKDIEELHEDLYDMSYRITDIEKAVHVKGNIETVQADIERIFSRLIRINARLDILEGNIVE